METFSAGKVIITAALTGALTTRKQCQYIPYTPVEVAEEARRCADAARSFARVPPRSAETPASVDREAHFPADGRDHPQSGARLLPRRQSALGPHLIAHDISF